MGVIPLQPEQPKSSQCGTIKLLQNREITSLFSWACLDFWTHNSYSYFISFGCPHQTSFVPEKWQDREVALTAVRSSGAALRQFRQ
jgi:hypothetical protein